MKPLKKICLLFVILISVASSCEEDKSRTLYEDMIEFDKSFVPVLYHVWNEDLEDAKRATFFLDHSWKKLNAKYQNISDEKMMDVKENIRMTGVWLEDAYTSIDNNHQERAYVYLDHVRYQLMEIRRKENMDYFLDYVWEFDAALDLALEPAGDLMWCLLEYCELNDLVDEVNYTWHQLNYANFDAAQFGFDDDKMFYYNFRKRNLKAAVKDFNVAIEVADGEEIAVKASILEDAYLEYLSLFGDFITSRTHYATR